MASPLEALSDCLQGMTALFPEGWLMSLRRTSRENNRQNNHQNNQENSPQNKLQNKLHHPDHPQSLHPDPPMGMWASRRVWGTLKTNRGEILMPPDKSRPKHAWMST